MRQFLPQDDNGETSHASKNSGYPYIAQFAMRLRIQDDRDDTHIGENQQGAPLPGLVPGGEDQHATSQPAKMPE
jgi:hypothetical protein